MSMLIITVGQRDVQFVKDGNCYGFDSFDMMKIQNKIHKGEINTEWERYRKGGNSLRQQGKRIKYEEIKDQKSIKITFPLLEKVLKKVKKDLNKDKVHNLNKIFLYFTDRHEIYEDCKDEKLKSFIEREPWLFAKLFQKHYYEIRKEYGLTALPENIVMIKIATKENDITRNSIIEFIDNDLNNKVGTIAKSDPLSKVIVACSGGLPDVKNVIEEVCSLYFPDNCFFYDQDQKNDDIRYSRYHSFKKIAKDKYELINRIKNWDFAAAYNICSKPTSFVSKYSDVFILIQLAHEWLSGDPDKAVKICEEFSRKDLEHKDLFATMQKMISEDKNSSTRSLIRLMHLYRSRNYWGAATVLITSAENICIRFIEHAIPGSYISDEGRFYYDIGIIKEFDSKFNPPKYLLKRNSTDLIIDSWSSFDEIITLIANMSDEKSVSAKEYANLLKVNFLKNSPFHKFKKEQRNEFIHKGDSMKKEVIDEILYGTNSEPDFRREDIGSPLIKKLIELIEFIHLDYVNWLPEISQEIIDMLITYPLSNN